jgi:hypothetical protein
MRKYITILFMFLMWCAKGQDYNDNCVACATIDGYYCGDDESNWTQYSPLGCVQNSWINDGWEDCVDASDENGATPTTMEECQLETVSCDTVYVEIPVVEYVYETDTIVEIEYIELTDTIVEIQYQEILEYIDCDTGLPCNTSIVEILKESQGSTLLYNLQGQVIRKPQGIYIQNGKVKWHK